MSGRRHRAVALVGCLALVTLPYWMPGVYYLNVSSQILFYAIFALGLNILAGYGGLVSLGHAGLFGIAAYATGYMLQAGFGHPVAILTALVAGLASMAVYAVLSLRATGIGFIMITLALGEIIWGLAYRWISITGGDNGINLHGRPEPFGIADHLGHRLLLHDAGGVPCGLGRGDCVRALAAGRRADGHARPAAPHDRARLSRLGDPLLGLHVFRPAHRDLRHSVRLLHAVHQPAGARPDRLGRGAADGDLRRRRHAARPDRRRRAGGGGQERGQRLHRALEHAARRHLRRHRHLHAGRPGARQRAAVAAGLAQDERAGKTARRRRASHERAHRQRFVQVVRRPARDHRRQSRRRARASGG